MFSTTTPFARPEPSAVDRGLLDRARDGAPVGIGGGAGGLLDSPMREAFNSSQNRAVVDAMFDDLTNQEGEEGEDVALEMDIGDEAEDVETEALLGGEMAGEALAVSSAGEAEFGVE